MLAWRCFVPRPGLPAPIHTIGYFTFRFSEAKSCPCPIRRLRLRTFPG
jgi:hypothetical protein